MAFRGFSDDALAFFAELEADNTKLFWTANKPRYDAEIKQPMADLVAELDDFGPFHTFRPYNDVRFAKGRRRTRRRSDRTARVRVVRATTWRCRRTG